MEALGADQHISCDLGTVVEAGSSTTTGLVDIEDALAMLDGDTVRRGFFVGSRARTARSAPCARLSRSSAASATMVRAWSSSRTAACRWTATSSFLWGLARVSGARQVPSPRSPSAAPASKRPCRRRALSRRTEPATRVGPSSVSRPRSFSARPCCGINSIIANSNSSGPSLLRVAASDFAVETTGCEQFKRIG